MEAIELCQTKAKRRGIQRRQLVQGSMVTTFLGRTYRLRECPAALIAAAAAAADAAAAAGDHQSLSASSGLELRAPRRCRSLAVLRACAPYTATMTVAKDTASA